MMNWAYLYFGHVHTADVLKAVADDYWQAIRRSMKGKSLEIKYHILLDYVTTAKMKYLAHKISKEEFDKVQIRSTNYVTALSRGGLIKPSDYRRI